MDVKKATTSTGFKLSVMTLAIMNITAVVSLRGLPAEAVYGLSSAFYYLFAAIVFLIPTAMVAAELAGLVLRQAGQVYSAGSAKPTAHARDSWPSGSNGSNRPSGTRRC